MEGLNEICWGNIEGHFQDAHHIQLIKIANKEWASGNLDFAIESGESPIQVWKRVNSALTTIFNRHRSGNILICTHGRTLRIILSQLLGYGLECMGLFQHHNTGINILIKQHFNFRAIRLNDIQHLNCISIEN